MLFCCNGNASTEVVSRDSTPTPTEEMNFIAAETVTNGLIVLEFSNQYLHVL